MVSQTTTAIMIVPLQAREEDTHDAMRAGQLRLLAVLLLEDRPDGAEQLLVRLVRVLLYRHTRGTPGVSCVLNEERKKRRSMRHLLNELMNAYTRASKNRGQTRFGNAGGTRRISNSRSSSHP